MGTKLLSKICKRTLTPSVTSLPTGSYTLLRKEEEEASQSQVGLRPPVLELGRFPLSLANQEFISFLNGATINGNAHIHLAYLDSRAVNKYKNKQYCYRRSICILNIIFDTGLVVYYYVQDVFTKWSITQSFYICLIVHI